MSQTESQPQTYSLEFAQDNWDEIESLAFRPFEIEREAPMTRRQWWAIGSMALGKAQLIDEGRYDWPGERRGHRAALDWSADLREIAETIFSFFRPGDGKL